MKKILLVLLAAVILSGCYTTFYPPANMDMSAANDIPDSTRQIIINNYYETTEYYQLPRYQRYSLLWGSYYWDPFYYDYDYYHWRPYYWYGHYYYYNPHTHYWYYYDHHYPWHSGSWTDGSGSNGDKGRVHKPGYSVLANTPTGGSVPFVYGSYEDNTRMTKPASKIGVDLNSDVTNNNDGYFTTSKPRIQSVGKTSVGTSDRTTTINKPASSNKQSKPSSTPSYNTKKQSSNSSSSSSSSSGKVSKPSNTNSTSSKNTSNESSSSSSKKSK